MKYFNEFPLECCYLHLTHGNRFFYFNIKQYISIIIPVMGGAVLNHMGMRDWLWLKKGNKTNLRYG